MTLDLAHVLTALAAAALLFAALHDIALRTIPNWISASLVIVGGLLRVLDHRLGLGIGCGVIVFGLTSACWWRGWLGGGDVKLLGATAILIPPALVPGYITTVALAGGGLAMLYLVLERLVPAPHTRMSASLPWRVFVIECRRIRRRASLPYATAITTAALLTLAGG